MFEFHIKYCENPTLLALYLVMYIIKPEDICIGFCEVVYGGGGGGRSLIKSLL